MQERLRQLLERIIDWWKKFNRKQQILLISVVAVVAIAIGLTAFIMTRPKMIELTSCEDTKQA